MSEHTKGPWTVDGTKGLGAYGVWTEYATHPGHDGQGYPSMVCSVYPNNMSDLPREQRDANARLLSAAPELLALARDYEQWEADLIMCEEAWRGGLAPLPTLTEELWDRLLTIQAKRNAAVRKATGEKRS